MRTGKAVILRERRSCMEDYISPSAARRQREKEQAEQNRRRRRMTFLRTVLMLAAMAALLVLILSITIPIYRSHNEKKAELEAEKAARLEELYELEIKYSTLSGMVNYTDNEPRYTRICEHKYFDPTLIDLDQTIITKEYPAQFSEGMIPYYTINDERNTKLAAIYLAEAAKLKNVYFLGRLATYRYLDMDDSIFESLSLAKHLLKRE